MFYVNLIIIINYFNLNIEVCMSRFLKNTLFINDVLNIYERQIEIIN